MLSQKTVKIPLNSQLIHSKQTEPSDYMRLSRAGILNEFSGCCKNIQILNYFSLILNQQIIEPVYKTYTNTIHLVRNFLTGFCAVYISKIKTFPKSKTVNYSIHPKASPMDLVSLLKISLFYLVFLNSLYCF